VEESQLLQISRSALHVINFFLAIFCLKFYQGQLTFQYYWGTIIINMYNILKIMVLIECDHIKHIMFLLEVDYHTPRYSVHTAKKILVYISSSEIFFKAFHYFINNCIL